MKADDSEGIVATFGAEGDEEVVNPLPPPPNGRAVLLYRGVDWLSGLVYVLLGAG